MIEILFTIYLIEVAILIRMYWASLTPDQKHKAKVIKQKPVIFIKKYQDDNPVQEKR